MIEVVFPQSLIPIDFELDELIAQRQDDINQFFTIAGFPYNFCLEKDGEKHAKAYSFLLSNSLRIIPNFFFSSNADIGSSKTMRSALSLIASNINITSENAFPYNFCLEKDGEKHAKAYLVPCEFQKEMVVDPKNRLSWGEKNAFSLVMFMFEAISDNC